MTGALQIDRSVSANSRELWEACATPRGLEGWYADRVTGSVAKGETIRIGWPGLSASMNLEVVDWRPEERIAYRSDTSTVTLHISEGRVSLTHTGLSDRDDVEGFSSSWRIALSLLVHSLEAQPGKRRRASWFLGRARTSARLAHVYFTASEGLSTWFGRGPGIGREGDGYSLRTLAGDSASGRVLVVEGGRDLALSWSEQGNSVLVFRSFPVPSSPSERILAVSWSRWTSRDESDDRVTVAEVNRLEGELKKSVERLSRALAQGGIA